MMRRAPLLTGLIAVMIAMPSVAAAQDAGYVDPYEAFYQSMENGYAPVKARYVDELINRRNQQDAAQHQAAPAWNEFGSAETMTTDNSSSDAAAVETPPETDVTDTGAETVDQGTQDSTFSLTPAEMRRVLREREHAQNGVTNPFGADASHEGAPLPITGMESNVAVAVMLAALGWTLWKARSAVTL